MAELPTLGVYLRHVIGRAESDTGARLKEIRAPTLVMVGDDEDHGSATGETHRYFAEKLARDIPGAKFVVLPGEGHHYPFYSPQKTHQIIRTFLTEK
jgi:pimeloyl-ACP methyl ester carboxylesterase